MVYDHPRQSGERGTEERMAWAGAGRLISHAPRLGRVSGRGLTPGLRMSPPPLTRGVARSEPGILSARTLRGSEGVKAIRRSGERRNGGENGLSWRGAADLARSAAPMASRPSDRERREERVRGVSAGWDEATCPCGSSTKIRMRHDSHPTKPPCGRHGGAYKGRWSTTTPPQADGEMGAGGGWTPMRDSGAVTIRSVDPG